MSVFVFMIRKVKNLCNLVIKVKICYFGMLVFVGIIVLSGSFILVLFFFIFNYV